MKGIALVALALLPLSPAAAQDITGDWHGALDVQGSRLRLVFHITKTDSGYATSMDSPDQGARGIVVALTELRDSTLTLRLPNLAAAFQGRHMGDSIAGTWNQGTVSLPLVLAKRALDTEAPRRPQEPARPYPYREEEIVFRNEADDVTLAGTLTLPSGTRRHPAVILISGSGPQDRDESVFGHRPFLVLADHLTRHGVAVLRYDDRGVGRSTGNFGTATSADFASDAARAVDYLKGREDIDGDNIGLIGHSEGAHVAAMVAGRSTDIAHIVLLAGIGTPGRDVSLMQSMTLRPFEVPDEAAYERFTRQALDIATSTEDLSVKRARLAAHWKAIEPVLTSMLPDGVDVDAFIAQRVALMTSRWQQFFLVYDPATDLQKVTVPVLCLNGSRDVQVPSTVHQAAIRRALERGGNRHYRIVELPGLNHMFQESATGAIDEYARIEQTLAPVVLNEISNWVRARVGARPL